jgi:type II secretory pathway component GspD/PulD (secretin)
MVSRAHVIGLARSGRVGGVRPLSCESPAVGTSRPGKWVPLAAALLVGWVGLTGAPLQAAPPPSAGGRGPARPADTAARLSPFQMITQARAALSEGDLGRAEWLARRAQHSGATYWQEEDSPQKVLADIAQARKDPKALLVASRAALRRKSLDDAEAFAKEARKRSFRWTFGLIGDSPAKVLRDIEAARRQSPPSPGAAPRAWHPSASRPMAGRRKAPQPTPPVRTVSTTPEDTRGGTRPGRTPRQPAPVVEKKPQGRASTSRPTQSPREVAESLVRQGRQQLQAGHLNEAMESARKAQAVGKLRWGLFKDSPKKLLDDVREAISKREKEAAARALASARRLYKEGHLAAAEREAHRAAELHGPYTWWDRGERPDDLIAQIRAARAKARPAPAKTRPAPAKTRPAPAAAKMETSPSEELSFLTISKAPTTSGSRPEGRVARRTGKGGESAPRSAQEQAVSLVERGRRELAEGKLDRAMKTAQQAQGIPGGRWGLFGDSPQKLLDDVREAIARRNKEESVRVLAGARKLYKQGHLDAAEREAHRAAKLHGPYTWWDRGERPDDLIEQIRTARGKTRPASAVAGKGDMGSPGTDKKPVGPSPPQIVSGVDDMGEPWPYTPAEKSADGPAPQVVKGPRDAGDPVPTPPGRKVEGPAPQLVKGPRDAGDPVPPTPGRKVEGPAPQVVKAPRDAGDPAPAPPGRKVEGPAPQVVKAPRDAGGPVPRPATGRKVDGPAPRVVKGPLDMGGKPGRRVSAREQAMTLVRQGRNELARGKLTEAMKTAQKAQTVSGVRWGLFEDNPQKLLRDVRTAITRRDKEESVRVLAGARKLYKQGHLDAAEREAHRAAKLHGPYTWWDLGDRPQSLIEEIRTARAKTRTVQLPPPPTAGRDAEVVKKDGTASQPRPAPAAPRIARGPKQDPTRARVRALVAEARKLQKEGKLVEARAKVIEAQKWRVTFAPGEDSPGLVYQQLAADARRAINRIVARAQRHIVSGTGDARERYRQAEKSLLQGRGLAVAFGQDTYRVDTQLSQVRRLIARAEQPKADQVARAAPLTPPSLPPVPGMTADPDTPMPRVIHPAPAPAAPPAPARPARSTPVMTQGQRLIAQARMELSKGELGTARRLAVEASKKQYGVYPVAVALLRTIDAEEQRQQAYRTLKTFDAAWSAYVRKDYHNAYNLLSTVNPDMLDEARQGKMREIMNTPEMQPRVAQGPKSPTPAEGGTRQVGHEKTDKPDRVGRARAEDGTPGNAPSDALLRSTQARRNVLFQKLHRDALEAQRQAAAKFRTGQTDEALDLLQDFLSRLGDESLDASQLALLRRPVESRLKRYRLLKAQQDMRTQTSVAAKTQKDALRRKALLAQQKHDNVARLMKQYNDLYKAAKYDQAHSLALQAKELDPDNEVITTAVIMSERQRNIQEYRDVKKDSEELWRRGLNAAEYEGPPEVVDNNIAFDRKHWDRVKKRDPLNAITTFRKMEKEREIESRLTRPVSLNFTDTPLQRVISDLHALTGINFHIDSPALREEGISLEQPVSLNLDQISLKSALNLMLHTAQLTYVIKNEVILITTEAHAQGQLTPMTYQVADLIIPIHNFADIRNPVPPATTGVPALGSPPFGQGGSYGLPGGSPSGSPSGSPTGSMLDQNSPFASASTGGAMRVQKQGPPETMEETLIKLITSTVSPRSWTNMGGPGTIDYFPYSMALVINQSSDIQEQIQDLLASLRRLQDQEVAVEVRFITINENFFERIGVKFSANILTDKVTSRFEPQITSGNFKPAGYINQFSPDRFLAGITPAGTFTGTLDIPINVQTFEQAVPPFGGYPGIPGFGGLAMGLAFLSDIQVFLFMEAVQGDTRNNIMQAPKLTLFNGQTATITAFDTQFFVTGVNAIPVSGTFIYQPQVQQFQFGVFLTIQAIISADRRFVRMSLTPQLNNLATGLVSLFPIVTPIFPLIDGTSTGQPIVFTQFIQQPVTTTLSVQTTVLVPDGGTVLLGGLKRLSEGRNEYGPPILSKVPYVNRLFRNVGYGRQASSLLMMVTPRIIIQEEEEERMTGVRRLPAVNF